jgi:hypothetical protein
LSNYILNNLSLKASGPLDIIPQYVRITTDVLYQYIRPEIRPEIFPKNPSSKRSVSEKYFSLIGSK